MGDKYCSGLCSKLVATAGVPKRILRNLGMLKILFFWPTRSDQYNTGPCEVSLMAKAIMHSGKANSSNNPNAKKKSNNLFTLKIYRRDFYLRKIILF